MSPAAQDSSSSAAASGSSRTLPKENIAGRNRSENASKHRVNTTAAHHARKPVLVGAGAASGKSTTAPKSAAVSPSRSSGNKRNSNENPGPSHRTSSKNGTPRFVQFNSRQHGNRLMYKELAILSLSTRTRVQRPEAYSIRICPGLSDDSHIIFGVTHGDKVHVLCLFTSLREVDVQFMQFLYQLAGVDANTAAANSQPSSEHLPNGVHDGQNSERDFAAGHAHATTTSEPLTAPKTAGSVSGIADRNFEMAHGSHLFPIMAIRVVSTLPRSAKEAGMPSEKNAGMQSNHSDAASGTNSAATGSARGSASAKATTTTKPSKSSKATRTADMSKKTNNELLNCVIGNNASILNSDGDELYVVRWLFNTPYPADDARRHCMLATAGRFGVIYIYDLYNKRFVYLRGHRGAVNDLAYNHEMPKLIISASDDFSLRLWDVDKAHCLAVFGGHESLCHDSKVIRCDIHSTGDYFVSAGLDGTVRFWPLRTSAKLMALIARVNSCRIDQLHTIAMEIFAAPETFIETLHEEYIDAIKQIGGSSVYVTKDTHKVKVWHVAHPLPLEAAFENDSATKFTSLRTAASGDALPARSLPCLLIDELKVDDESKDGGETGNGCWYTNLGVYDGILCVSTTKSYIRLYDYKNVVSPARKIYHKLQLRRPHWTKEYKAPVDVTIRDYSFGGDGRIMLCSTSCGLVYAFQRQEFENSNNDEGESAKNTAKSKETEK